MQHGASSRPVTIHDTHVWSVRNPCVADGLFTSNSVPVPKRYLVHPYRNRQSSSWLCGKELWFSSPPHTLPPALQGSAASLAWRSREGPDGGWITRQTIQAMGPTGNVPSPYKLSESARALRRGSCVHAGVPCNLRGVVPCPSLVVGS